MTTLETPNLWPLLAGGRCSDVPFCYKTETRQSDCYSEVVASSGFTVVKN